MSAVLHWYDLTCPFCYLAQASNDALLASGVNLVELPFQAHPDVPADGLTVGPRTGPMYDQIARLAREAKLPLRWRDKLPNSRLALSASEWARRHAPARADHLRRALFHAHFAGDQDIGDRKVVLGLCRYANVDLMALNEAWADGSAYETVEQSEMTARRKGVGATPVWEIGGQLIAGLRSAAEVVQLASLDES